MCRYIYIYIERERLVVVLRGRAPAREPSQSPIASVSTWPRDDYYMYVCMCV